MTTRQHVTDVIHYTILTTPYQLLPYQVVDKEDEKGYYYCPFLTKGPGKWDLRDLEDDDLLNFFDPINFTSDKCEKCKEMIDCDNMVWILSNRYSGKIDMKKMCTQCAVETDFQEMITSQVVPCQPYMIVKREGKLKTLNYKKLRGLSKNYQKVTRYLKVKDETAKKLAGEFLEYWSDFIKENDYLAYKKELEKAKDYQQAIDILIPIVEKISEENRKKVLPNGYLQLSYDFVKDMEGRRYVGTNYFRITSGRLTDFIGLVENGKIFIIDDYTPPGEKLDEIFLEHYKYDIYIKYYRGHIPKSDVLTYVGKETIEDILKEQS